MTDDQVQDVLDRVRTWTRERQEDAARLLESMETQDTSPLMLSDEQVAAIESRLSDTDAAVLSLHEFNRRFERSNDA